MQDTINSKYKSLRTSILIDTLCVPMLNVVMYRVGTHKKLKENTELALLYVAILFVIW
jgi:hypothetical protein